MKTSAAIVFACFLVSATSVSALAEAQSGRASVKAQNGRDRITCRRFVRTGSLVDSYRTCKSNREWQREHENLQQLSVSDSCRDRANGGSLCGP